MDVAESPTTDQDAYGDCGVNLPPSSYLTAMGSSVDSEHEVKQRQQEICMNERGYPDKTEVKSNTRRNVEAGTGKTVPWDSWVPESSTELRKEAFPLLEEDWVRDLLSKMGILKFMDAAAPAVAEDLLDVIASVCEFYCSEEDIYRDAEEIEREKMLLVCETGSSEHKLSVAPEMDIMEYCVKEWRGNTPVAKRMKKGYEAVSQKFAFIRRVRGDNYCALRATLFQALSQATQLPSWLQSADFTMLPEKLLSKYDWIKQWQLKQKLGRKMGEISDEIKEYLMLLKKKWKNISEIKAANERQEACDELFKNEEEEYSLYEALKFLMLNTAIELYNDDKNGRRVPVFSWLLFARDTSSNPCQLMHNHLNQIGHSGGLEQVEMFLLAYTLRYTIQVYRLYKYNTDEFITLYPNDPKEDWPVVTLITEDDRHYNIPVGMCQETVL
ncbi:PREDICTED: ubiquitin thioesterase otulin [Tinamus guttatus]|nr:PREDICTED: ubiquitin thioesterase otulin [Tinamus guttatus]